MNEQFIDNCVGNVNVLIDKGFRPLASTLGFINGIVKRDDGKIVLQTDWGEFEVCKECAYDLRKFGILTVVVSGKCGECKLDVCDVRVMAALGKIGDAEQVFGKTLRFPRGISTRFDQTETEAFEVCRDRGYPGCLDRFEHFLRTAYWIDQQGLPVKSLYEFAELDARLISLIPNVYRNDSGRAPNRYFDDMQRYGVALHSRYNVIPRVVELMNQFKNLPQFDDPK